jgi:hypothetical protein
MGASDPGHSRADWAAERCAAALQKYLTNDTLPPWDGLPNYEGAQKWVWDQCKGDA